MAEVSLQMTFEGFDEPALGLVGVVGVENPIISLSPLKNKAKLAQVTYDSRTNILTMKTDGGSISIQAKLNPGRLDINQQLQNYVSGGQATVTIKNVSSSMVGMLFEPVVQ